MAFFIGTPPECRNETSAQPSELQVALHLHALRHQRHVGDTTLADAVDVAAALARAPDDDAALLLRVQATRRGAPADVALAVLARVARDQRDLAAGREHGGDIRILRDLVRLRVHAPAPDARRAARPLTPAAQWVLPGFVQAHAPEPPRVLTAARRPRRRAR